MEGQTIKNKQEILELLKVLWLPKKLAVMHCSGYQKGKDAIQRQNKFADQKAKKAALISTTVTQLILTDPDPLSLPLQQNYNSDEETWDAQIGGAYKRDQWWRL